MSKSFTKEEKMVLIAVMKYIVSTDGIVTDREVDDINELAEEKGFEDFQEIFNEVDRTVKSMDDLKKLVKQIEHEGSRKKIIKYAVEFSRADADVNPHEIEILKYMCNVWNINLKALLDEG
ncbi:MAG: TerB family tellurite resistance protein [Spirochaetes bacterium]|nr:TerB family tellurite resistance protein [Spirochaetota bacterium]